MIKNIISRYGKFLKVIYFSFILLVLILGINSIRKQVHIDTLKQGFNSLGLINFIILAIIGILTILPMCIYDYVYLKQIRVKSKVSIVIVKGYVINTITNLIGNIVGSSLRGFLYPYQKNIKTKTSKVAQVAMFSLVGLSINSILILMYNLVNINQLKIYQIIILLITGLYGLIILGIYQQQIIKIDLLKLILGSFLEWTSCFIFFDLIGVMLGYSFNIFDIYQLICISAIIGIISFIPGGLGSFDTFMLIELPQQGINVNHVLMWLVIYRITYYLIPFIVGLIMLGILKIKNSINN